MDESKTPSEGTRVKGLFQTPKLQYNWLRSHVLVCACVYVVFKERECEFFFVCVRKEETVFVGLSCTTTGSLLYGSKKELTVSLEEN